jgi:hypothetical protein
MSTITTSSDAVQLHCSKLSEALQVYERRFGSPPDWLDDLSHGRILALILQALRRGAPVTAADVLH